MNTPLNIVPFECDPAMADRIRAAIRHHVSERNARDSILADRLDRIADDAQKVAGELRGRGLELAL